MLSILGSVLGFGTSFLPKVLGFFEEKRDQAHELQMMDKQLEQQLQIGVQSMSTPTSEKQKFCIKNTQASQRNHRSGLLIYQHLLDL